jgi:iron(III) transport system ATP-binding protein
MNLLAATMNGGGSVRLGQVDLVCPSPAVPPGAAVTVAIRPEDIVLEGSAKERNAFHARIDALEFLGSFVRADLIIDGMGGACLKADVPIHLVRRSRIEEGGRVTVTIPPESIRIYAGRRKGA